MLQKQKNIYFILLMLFSIAAIIIATSAQATDLKCQHERTSGSFEIIASKTQGKIDVITYDETNATKTTANCDLLPKALFEDVWFIKCPGIPTYNSVADTIPIIITIDKETKLGSIKVGMLELKVTCTELPTKNTSDPNVIHSGIIVEASFNSSDNRKNRKLLLKAISRTTRWALAVLMQKNLAAEITIPPTTASKKNSGYTDIKYRDLPDDIQLQRAEVFSELARNKIFAQFNIEKLTPSEIDDLWVEMDTFYTWLLAQGFLHKGTVTVTENRELIEQYNTQKTKAADGIRTQAARLLGQLGVRKARPIFELNLMSEMSPSARYEYLFALSKFGFIKKNSLQQIELDQYLASNELAYATSETAINKMDTKPNNLFDYIVQERLNAQRAHSKCQVILLSDYTQSDR